VLNAVYGLLNGCLDNPILKVFTIAIAAFLGTYVLISLIALLPKSKWIVGRSAANELSLSSVVMKIEAVSVDVFDGELP
jgi:hypothetical protein